MRFRFTLATLAAALAFSGGALASPAEDLIKAGKCSKCHTATTTKKGPSWASVAKKYEGKADAPAKLLEFLKNGGGPEDHDKVVASEADIKSIVSIVLTSK